MAEAKLSSAIQPRAGEGVTQVTLRLPEVLRDKLKLTAGSVGQSMNTFVVLALEEKVQMKSPSEKAEKNAK
ncbi:Arc family DNA-binding protein [Roseobacter sp. HKCCD9010]|uniref:Arc family DNA-binding protein n=1 Tax=unclassified Roseobacter TaxID=196798 RepID=UPI0014917E4E|nr:MULTISPECIES: Arc family DNA-binding protein [unclassified Roseobacter]MBF9050629.1 Arc family DNA-binding protein [Rhodobacterales bacterium HKCCD4356]NNV11953.1 Arc family DNA-binding protein [Roseobacter sp. HKCCD7357]NNV16966.1 Arc family DNA-binding protein [Roseobacter sp. HKCCD8768]NNV26195.1 Arc family DNA-binding protein [Roseobacter sp. HKCCD8192]NNV30690.1 Arc family DNA-binding protein [Roseobacter sp. HKCCD9061]NNV34954.1 Arc family DNA-binding protein [Roseobacter sp. HKCCD90